MPSTKPSHLLLDELSGDWAVRKLRQGRAPAWIRGWAALSVSPNCSRASSFHGAAWLPPAGQQPGKCGGNAMPMRMKCTRTRPESLCQVGFSPKWSQSHLTLRVPAGGREVEQRVCHLFCEWYWRTGKRLGLSRLCEDTWCAPQDSKLTLARQESSAIRANNKSEARLYVETSLQSCLGLRVSAWRSDCAQLGPSSVVGETPRRFSPTFSLVPYTAGQAGTALT